MLRRPQASSECGPALAFERRGIGRPPRSISKKILNESVKLRRTRRRERQLKNLRQKGNHKLWGGAHLNSIIQFRNSGVRPSFLCLLVAIFFLQLLRSGFESLPVYGACSSSGLE